MKKKTLRRLQRGDAVAFHDFYEEYAGRAIRTAIAITKQPELAKDAVQETFLRVYRSIHQYETRYSFNTWFYRILTNECFRLLKREAPFVNTQEIDIEQFSGHSSFTNSLDLYDLLQSLDDRYRIPLILKYVNGFTEKELATILQLNQNTVKSRLFKGRQKLKVLWDRIEQEGDSP